MILVPVLLIAAVLVASLGIYLYNQLVRLRTMVREGWSGIDVQLNRRTNLIPNLVETIKGYLGHERALLEKVTELRSQSMRVHDLPQKQAVENALTGGLARLFAIIENYPDLKADQHFQELQHQLAEIEDQIQLSRRYYNGTVRNLNIAIETFPSSIIARWFAFETASFFEILQPAERALPKVAF
jgi:LemA protein